MNCPYFRVCIVAGKHQICDDLQREYKKNILHQNQVHRNKYTLLAMKCPPGSYRRKAICCLGYSDFHNLTRFTSKKLSNTVIFFKMCVEKVFQLLKPFLANLHSTSSKKYLYMFSMTPNFNIFFAFEYKKYADFFYAEFKSVEIIEKSAPKKTYLPKTFAGYQYRRGQTLILHTFFAYTFFVSKFLALF